MKRKNYETPQQSIFFGFFLFVLPYDQKFSSATDHKKLCVVENRYMDRRDQQRPVCIALFNKVLWRNFTALRNTVDWNQWAVTFYGYSKRERKLIQWLWTPYVAFKEEEYVACRVYKVIEQFWSCNRLHKRNKEARQRFRPTHRL